GFGDHALAEGNDVRIVVRASQPGGLDIPADRSADAADAIGHDRLAVSGAAENDAAFEVATSHRFSRRPDEWGIVDGIRRCRSKIRDVVPFCCNVVRMSSLYRNPA